MLETVQQVMTSLQVMTPLQVWTPRHGWCLVTTQSDQPSDAELLMQS